VVAGSDASGFIVKYLYIVSVAPQLAMHDSRPLHMAYLLFTRNGLSIVNVSGLMPCSRRAQLTGVAIGKP
jgi:hypothetical protein